MFRIEMSSWWVFPFMCMMNPSLSLLINFVGKSILLDIRMATPACFLDQFAWKTLFQPSILGNDYLFLVICVSYIQQNNGFC